MKLTWHGFVGECISDTIDEGAVWQGSLEVILHENHSSPAKRLNLAQI